MKEKKKFSYVTLRRHEIILNLPLVTSLFNRTPVKEIIDASAATIQGEVVSCKSQTNSVAREGNNSLSDTDLAVFEKEKCSVLLRFGRHQTKSLFKTFSYLSSSALNNNAKHYSFCKSLHEQVVA